MEGGGITEFTGEGSGDQSSPTEYKDCRIRGGEGEDHKSVTKPYGRLDKCYQDTVKIAQLSPPTQAINSDPSPRSLMHLDRIDLQKLNFFSTLNI